MSEWNISVRLTGQGAGLSRTLRGLSRDARAASRDIAELRRDIGLLRAEAARDIRLRVRLDDSARLRRELDNAIRSGRGQRITIPIGLRDPHRLRAEVAAAVRYAEQNQVVRLRVTADTSALRNLPNLAAGSSSSSGGSGVDFGLSGLTPLATAAIPVIAALTASMTQLAAAFGAGGAAATAFGIALAGQTGALSEVAEAEKAYQDAVSEHGKSSAEAAQAQLVYQRQLSSLPPETQKAAIAISQLKDTFREWSDNMSGFTMQPLTKGVTVLDQLIPRLTPHVKIASTQLDRLITLAGGAIQTPGFDALNAKFERFTAHTLDRGIDQLTVFLAKLNSGEFDGGQLRQWWDYAQRVGPQVFDTLSKVGDALLNLLEAGADVGIGMLEVVRVLADLVSAVPPQAIATFLQLAIAIKAVNLAVTGTAAARAALAGLGAQIAAMRASAAGAPTALAGVGAAITGLSRTAKAAIAGTGIGLLLIALGELSAASSEPKADVDALASSLVQLGRSGKVSGEALRVYGKDLGELSEALDTLYNPSGFESFLQSWAEFLGMDSTGVKIAKEKIDEIDQALASLVSQGKADQAAAALDMTLQKLNLTGKKAAQFRGELDAYKNALAGQALEQELAAQAMGLFGRAAQETQAKLDAQKRSADALRQSIIALNDVNRSAGSAMNAFEQSIDDVAAATKNHAGALRMRNGEIDRDTQKAREADRLLSELAANTDAAAAAAREQGKSWEYVTSIQERGRQAFIDAARAMGLTKVEAEALANRYLAIPDKKSTRVEMQTQDAIAGLDAVIAAIEATPDAKSVTVNALTAEARKLLSSLGYQVETLPDGRVRVTAITGSALSGLYAVKRARDSLTDKTITITTNYVITGNQARRQGAFGAQLANAEGGLWEYYSVGGLRIPRVRGFANGAENHVAQIAPAGAWRVWAEPETGGEAYIPLSPAKRVRSRAIVEETVRRLGGDPAGIQWNADGSVTDWRYDPITGSLYSPSDAGQAGRKTKKVKVKGKGGKVTTKEVSYFDLGAVEKKLKAASKATQAWNRDLEKIAERVGGDVAEALASMGEDGMKLAAKMARGSTKYINEMAAALRNLQATAKASLTDYTRQLTNANKLNKTFSDNLAKLAAQGYGDLAAQLAEQNDQAAQQLAAAAVKDSSKASKANTAAKAANAALTADEVRDLVQIIAAIRTKTTGIHDVAAATGLGEDVIIAIANKAKGQISSSLGTRATRFLADLGKANKGLAYADGGIRAGLYALQGGIIRFAEPSTGGEAYIPLSPTKRRTALPVLANVASRFGLGLTDANHGKVVVIREQGPLIGQQINNVTSGGNARDTARQVEERFAYQLRRYARGGVAARG